MSTKLKATDVHEGSGNVFADLGLAGPKDRQHKAELANQINSIIRQRGLTQKEAAKLLGIDQPKVSDLSRGKLRSFSIERLLDFLALLDCHVELIVSRARKGREAGLFVVGTTW